MNISIIIVNYNCKDYLSPCLQSIIQQTKGLKYEIIIVDNGSKDGSIELLKTEYPNVKLIESKENLGFGRANNLGAKVANGEYLFLLNPDTILQNNAIKVLWDNAVINKDKIGCCGAQLVDENGDNANIGGNFPSLFLLFSDIGFRLFYPHYYRKKLSLLWTIDDLPPSGNIKTVCGADLLIERRLFNEINGFDNDFFLYFEDTHLCYKLYSKGLKNYIFTDAKIKHLESVSISTNRAEKLNINKFRFFETGKHLYFSKTKSTYSIFWIKCISVCFIFTRYIVRQCSWKDAFSMIKFTILLNVLKKDEKC